MDMRQTLVAAALTVLEQEGEANFSTRAVCALAKVTAPTLYHHFGNADGLLSAAIQEAFAQYLAGKSAAIRSSADPVIALRNGWDNYVRFAAERPRLYAAMMARLLQGADIPAARQARAMLDQQIAAIAAAGRLAMPARSRRPDRRGFGKRGRAPLCERDTGTASSRPLRGGRAARQHAQDHLHPLIRRSTPHENPRHGRVRFPRIAPDLQTRPRRSSRLRLGAIAFVRRQGPRPRRHAGSRRSGERWPPHLAQHRCRGPFGGLFPLRRAARALFPHQCRWHGRPVESGGTGRGQALRPCQRRRHRHG